MGENVVKLVEHKKKAFQKEYEKACIAYYGTTYINKAKEQQA